MRDLLDQLLPFLYKRGEVKRISARIAMREKKGGPEAPLDPSWSKYLALDSNDLRDSLRVELSRREFVHRRSQTFLSSIAVMTAFTLGAANALRGQQHTVPTWLIAPSIVATFLYLAAGGWYALMTVRPAQLYDLFLQNRAIDDRTKTPAELNATVLSLIQLNQAHSLVFSAFAERTYRCIRNGVLVLVGVLTMVVCDAAVTGRVGRAPHAQTQKAQP